VGETPEEGNWALWSRPIFVIGEERIIDKGRGK
jgi:hypothetical protein